MGAAGEHWPSRGFSALRCWAWYMPIVLGTWEIVEAYPQPYPENMVLD